MPGGTDQGRVPFALRIGVTGHRKLADPSSITTAVREAIALIKNLIPATAATPVVLVAVSALAEGSDRIVAHEVLAEPGAQLDVALPMARTEYAQDFQDNASKEEFRDLLARARHIWQAPEVASREEAYERAGHHVVDHCDVLICIWDGQPARGRGGTQEIVQYARDHAVPLIWISTNGAPALRPELPANRVQTLVQTARDLNEFNAAVIKESAYRAQFSRMTDELGIGHDPARAASDPLRASCQASAHWVLQYYVRSDLLALRLQRRFQVISVAVFAMAAAAVAVVALQVSFWPAERWITVFEVVLLLLLLAAPEVRRRIRLHDRWTSHRFLAERLRSAYFLALVGTGSRESHRRDEVSLTEPSVRWIERALAHIMAGRPEAGTAGADLQLLREYLGEYWIEAQSRYQVKAAARHNRWDVRLTRTTLALFAVTLVSAVLHLSGVVRGRADTVSFAALLIVLSISVPAIGAAVHGIATQGMYRHHGDRCERTAALLDRLRARMTLAESVEEVRRVAIDAERLMREEANDWFGVMRFHDVELVT